MAFGSIWIRPALKKTPLAKASPNDNSRSCRFINLKGSRPELKPMINIAIAKINLVMVSDIPDPCVDWKMVPESGVKG